MFVAPLGISQTTLPNRISIGLVILTCAQLGDTCSAIAATNDITIDEIDSYNNNTWGWLACDVL
jgi:hypothetical protein